MTKTQPEDLSERDRETLRILAEELYEFTGGEIWDAGPAAISGQLKKHLDQLADAIKADEEGSR